MEEFLKVPGFTALPALGNLGGDVLAEVFRISQKTLSLAFTAGILLTVVVEDMSTEAYREEAALLLVGGFALFALVYPSCVRGKALHNAASIALKN